MCKRVPALNTVIITVLAVSGTMQHRSKRPGWPEFSREWLMLALLATAY